MNAVPSCLIIRIDRNEGSFPPIPDFAPVVLVKFKRFRLPGIASIRADAAQTALVYLTLLMALALLAAILAHWTRTLFIAPPEPAGEPATTVTGNAAPAGELFGFAQPHAPLAAAAGPDISLSGVAAASGGGRGYAIMQLDGKEILAVPEGGNIASDVRLAEVHPDHVVVERNGAREILVWPEKRPLAETAIPLESDTFSQGAVPHTYE